MKIFNFFGKKQNFNKIENLPDLIRKINRNELITYKNTLKIEILYITLNVNSTLFNLFIKNFQ